MKKQLLKTGNYKINDNNLKVDKKLIKRLLKNSKKEMPVFFDFQDDKIIGKANNFEIKKTGLFCNIELNEIGKRKIKTEFFLAPTIDFIEKTLSVNIMMYPFLKEK